jgi:hypothetical protein
VFRVITLFLIFVPLVASEPTPAPESEPGSEPIKMWDGLPLLPSAEEGRVAGPSYIYAAKVPFSAAEAFYAETLKAEGWTVSVKLRSEKGMFGGPVVSLEAERGEKRAGIIIVYSTADERTLVTLASFASKQEADVSVGPDASLKWAEFTSAPGRFTIMFPGSPEEVQQDISTPAGLLILHIHSLIVDGEYSVTWGDYPFNPSERGTLDKFLDTVVHGAVAETGNTLVSQSKSEVGGYPCRDLHEREQSGRTMHAKVCIVGSRHYQVAITYPRLPAEAKDVETRWEQVSSRFLASFRLLSKGTKESNGKH